MKRADYHPYPDFYFIKIHFISVDKKGQNSIVRSIAQKFEGCRRKNDDTTTTTTTTTSPRTTKQNLPVDILHASNRPTIAIATSSSPSSSSSNSRSASPSSAVAAAGGDASTKVRHLSRGSSRSAEALFSALLQLYNINDFELSHLGSGFYGDVFKALHLETEEVMVLKKNKFKGGAHSAQS